MRMTSVSMFPAQTAHRFNGVNIRESDFPASVSDVVSAFCEYLSEEAWRLGVPAIADGCHPTAVTLSR